MTGYIGAVKNIKVVVSGSRKATFNVTKYEGVSAQQIAWLANNTDVSWVKANQTASVNVRIGHSGYGYTNDSSPITTSSSGSGGSISGASYAFSGLAQIGIPTSINLNTSSTQKKKLNFQFYKDNGTTSYGTWSNSTNSGDTGSYNHAIMGNCYHISDKFTAARVKGATIKILQILILHILLLVF